MKVTVSPRSWGSGAAWASAMVAAATLAEADGGGPAADRAPRDRLVPERQHAAGQRPERGGRHRARRRAALPVAERGASDGFQQLVRLCQRADRVPALVERAGRPARRRPLAAGAG